MPTSAEKLIWKANFKKFPVPKYLDVPHPSLELPQNCPVIQILLILRDESMQITTFPQKGLGPTPQVFHSTCAQKRLDPPMHSSMR